MLLAFLRRLRMTRFERAYVALYRDKIALSQFPAAAGYDDADEALRDLHEYRRKVLTGELPDPLDRY